MTKELFVLMDNGRMGRVLEGEYGKLTFLYDEHWRDSGYPLSLSMPLDSPNIHPKRSMRFFGDCCPRMKALSTAWAAKTTFRRATRLD
jgi:HipA-like protein